MGALAARRGPGLGLGGRVLPVYCSTVFGGCCYLVTIVMERIAPLKSLLRKTSRIHVLESYSMDRGERPPDTVNSETKYQERALKAFSIAFLENNDTFDVTCKER